MKLLFCPSCQDVRKLLQTTVTCSCGASSGAYLDEVNAWIAGKAVPLGIANRSFGNALQHRPEEGWGCKFEAFVIPQKCQTIMVCGDIDAKKRTSAGNE